VSDTGGSNYRSLLTKIMQDKDIDRGPEFDEENVWQGLRNVANHAFPKISMTRFFWQGNKNHASVSSTEARQAYIMGAHEFCRMWTKRHIL